MTDAHSQSPSSTPPETPSERQPEKLEGRYSLVKGGLYVAFYTIVLGGAVYVIAMQLTQANSALKFVGYALSLAFLYMWALQIRMLIMEARDGRPTFVLTESGIQLRPLNFVTIPWKDVTNIQISRAKFLPSLFGGGYVGVTIKENSKLAPALADWNKGKGEANEFFLATNNMQLSFEDLAQFVKKTAR